MKLFCLAVSALILGIAACKPQGGDEERITKKKPAAHEDHDHETSEGNAAATTLADCKDDKGIKLAEDHDHDEDGDHKAESTTAKTPKEKCKKATEAKEKHDHDETEEHGDEEHDHD